MVVVGGTQKNLNFGCILKIHGIFITAVENKK